MMSTQMEEQKECDTMGSQLQDGKRINEDIIEKEEARKQYHLFTLVRSGINEDINQLKADEQVINRKLMWFSQHDMYNTHEIKSLERYLGKTNLSVSRTTGSLRLPERDDRTLLRPDRKRSQIRLIKKGRMDMDHLQQVKEQLLSLKKSGGTTLTSSGTQQVNDLIESTTLFIHHGSKNRVEEMRIYLEMRNLKETREVYIAPAEPNQNRSDNWYSIERPSKYHVNLKQYPQHTINIRLDDIEDLKMDLKGRKARVSRLKAELELVRKSIGCLKKKLEDVNTKRIKAYRRAYDLGEQKK